MSFSNLLFSLLIGPLQLLFEVIFSCANKITNHPGLTIISLSLSMNFLILPLYMRADALQEEERDIQMKLAKGVAHIKKTFKGDERMMMLQTYYRQNDYKPTYVLRGAMSLFLEIPFFIAAYRFLSTLPILEGVQFGPIADLGKPDRLIVIAGIGINLLPILMTAINAVSTAIFTKGYPIKTKIQLYGMALFFLVFLYDSPAGLVFYWTLNNLFSLVKTIFYKLKNPKKVLAIMGSLVGICAIIFGCRYIGISMARLIVFAGIGIALQFPVLYMLAKKKGILKETKAPAKEDTNAGVFLAAAVLMTILVGILIPSAVIKTSPLEFVNVAAFYNPIWYVVSAGCLAAGTFVVWLNVFYRLSANKGKIIIENILCAFSVAAIVDYMFFGKNLGTLLPSLQYENGMSFAGKETLLNLLAVLVSVAVVAAIVIKKKKILSTVLLVGILAFGIMAVMNIVSIRGEVSELVSKSEENNEVAEFTLSREGENVVVIMLDRALGEYVPYIMSERPELIDKYAGFTYYSDTLSYGGHTNFASPALFGGYEYMPEKIQARSDEPLADKQDESLKVMPVLFSNAGYDVTVCDPAYAGYQWIPDLTIYDDYPQMHTYITDGMFVNDEINEATIKTRNRNFFCYGLTKAMPIALQATFYENGNYHNLSSVNMDSQTVHDLYTADGLNAEFEKAYAVLEKMSDITKIDEGTSNNFLMMCNDTTHEQVLLQREDYSLSTHVDNTAYEQHDRSADAMFGKASQTILKVTEDPMQLTQYDSEMAAFIKLGEWFDYLREEGVYDNTRIILVSDHGNGLFQMEGMDKYTDNVNVTDLEYFFPLLMVKDFGAKDFKVSNEFMTNADTPSIALKGIVENPVNPFTGNAIDMTQKETGIQYVFESDLWETKDNNGNIFKPGKWFAVDTEDIWNQWSWFLVAEDSATPTP